MIVEIGPRAAAALERARSAAVVMEFARGEVLQTDHGEIVWIDSDPEAFSPCGIRTACHPDPGERAAAVSGAPAHPPDPLVALEEARFLDDLRSGIALADAAEAIVGLGPGLTPSGDDFLGGFLLVLARRGTPQTIDTTNTHAISRARLAMHMLGEGTRAEVRFVEALLRGHDTRVAEGILRRHGHSSGHDFMRGARAALAMS